MVGIIIWSTIIAYMNTLGNLINSSLQAYSRQVDTLMDFL
eukprot:gene53643-18065_t